MNASIEAIKSPHDQEVCTIVVLYDDNVTRSRALVACDYLVNQFWPEIELKFHWWRTDFLRDGVLARVAADAAVASDFLILGSASSGELSAALESWFESWLERRGERNGALVDLAASPRSSDREFFLREVARRGNFDYLTSVPAEVGNSFKDLSPRVDNILGESRPPSHYGLNE